jgi:hypothetical protein
MSDLTDIRHVAKSRKEDLIDLGYDDIEAVMEANPDDLTSLSRVGENKAMEMIVSAENLAEDTESESDTDTSESSESLTSDTITLDEENTSNDNMSDELSDEMKMRNMNNDTNTGDSETNNNTMDGNSESEDVTDVIDTDVISTRDVSDIEAVDDSEEVYSLNLDLNAEQHLILLHALYAKYLHLQSRDRSRAEDCHYLAQAYSANPESVLVNRSHLNTLFDVLREEKITYQSKYYENELPLCIDLFEQVVEFRNTVL